MPKREMLSNDGIKLDPIQVTNAAAYIRVSTDEQAESGYSLQLQRERIAAH